MKKCIKKPLIITGNIILLLLVTLALYTHFKLAPYNTIDKKFVKKYELVFDATSKLTDYSIAINKYSMAREGFEQINYENGKKVLSNEDLRHKIATANKQLNIALNKVAPKYGSSIQPTIQAFMDWNNSHDPIKAINKSHASELNWHQAYSDQEDHLLDGLRNITGFYEVNDKTDAYTMSLVSMAKKQLMENPNDPKLCKLSANYPNHDVPIKDRAKQIAFIELGAKYCDKYYHLASSWGASHAITKQTYVKTANPYEKLPYAKYYNQDVYPLVVNVISNLKKGDLGLKYWCQRKGLWNLSSRDPKLDAVRVAYQLYGKKMCKKYDNSIQDTKFTRSGAFCIILINEICSSPNGCDLIERCSTVAGESITY